VWQQGPVSTDCTSSPCQPIAPVDSSPSGRSRSRDSRIGARSSFRPAKWSLFLERHCRHFPMTDSSRIYWSCKKTHRLGKSGFKDLIGRQRFLSGFLRIVGVTLASARRIADKAVPEVRSGPFWWQIGWPMFVNRSSVELPRGLVKYTAISDCPATAGTGLGLASGC
jgi:hypothetical protein